MIETKCPVCFGDDYTVWGRENGFRAVKCAACGAVYVNPRPPLEAISEAAKTGLHPTEQGTLNVKAKRFDSKVTHYRAVVQRMLGTERGAWLDVGAGYGELVEAVSPWYKAQGIEPMAIKVQAAQRRGLPVTQTPLSEVEGTFDIISLINVFSHIPDFDDFASQLRARLKPGGRLFLETGNGGDLNTRAEYPDRLYLPDHLVFAGVENMQQILGRCGFEVEAVEKRRLSLMFHAKAFAKAVVDRRAPSLGRSFRTVFYVARAI